jgi:hypothetical protein
MARIWSMRFNLDTFNAAYSVLDDDQEKAQFLTGFSRGLNGAPTKDGATEANSSGFTIGSGMRHEAVLASERGAEFAKRKGTQKEPSGNPKGTLGGASEEDAGLPEGLGLRIKDFPSQDVPVPRLEPVPTTRATRPRKGKPARQPKLEAILGPKGSPDDLAYWKLVGIFGGAKNPAPTQTAQAFVEAILTTPVHSILAKAQNLRDSLSGPQFMPQIQKWLDGQGYLNPDATTAKGPSHRADTDSDWAYPEKVINA